MIPSSTDNALAKPATRLAALVLFALALAGITAGTAIGKSAEEKLEALEKKIDTARDREGVLTTEIEAMGEKIASLEGQVTELRGQEAAAEAELAAKQTELDQAVVKLEEAIDELEVIRVRLRRALNILRDRLVAIYMSGTPDIASIVLAASDYGDMVSVAEYAEQIQRSDEVVVDRVRTLREDAENLVEIRRDAKSTIEAARDQIAAEENRLEVTRTALESREGALVAARTNRQSTLEGVQGGIHKYEDIAADLRAKIEKEVAEATTSAALPTGPEPAPSDAGFIWPVEGTFTSPFGARWGSMHEGIDIAAPGGTPIRAAASGTVVLMQSEAESGGYGNYTCVDHGGGLATCYAHQSGFATSTGATVSQGDVIGYVGNTGHSFGDHLHFEVRIDGAAVDPMGYL